MFAIELAYVIWELSTDIKSISQAFRFWDLTYQVDGNNVFGVLQFETRSHHDKVQVKAIFHSHCFINTHPCTREAIFYSEFSDDRFPTNIIHMYKRLIDNSIRFVHPNLMYGVYYSKLSDLYSELTGSLNIYWWESRSVL